MAKNALKVKPLVGLSQRLTVCVFSCTHVCTLRVCPACSGGVFVDTREKPDRPIIPSSALTRTKFWINSAKCWARDTNQEQYTKPDSRQPLESSWINYSGRGSGHKKRKQRRIKPSFLIPNSSHVDSWRRALTGFHTGLNGPPGGPFCVYSTHPSTQTLLLRRPEHSLYDVTWLTEAFLSVSHICLDGFTL